jgi:hypothetical protein
MTNETKSCVLLKIGFVLLISGTILLTTVGAAQQSVVELPDYYPDRFSGAGCIDSLTDKSVVIDDRMLKISPSTTFHTLKTQYASRTRFRVGMRVGFIKNSQNELDSVWYIQKCR